MPTRQRRPSCRSNRRRKKPPKEIVVLTRLARTSFHHRRAVVGLWVLVFVVAIAAGSALAGDYAKSGRLPNTDSQAAYDRLAQDFPARHGDEGQIVFADIRQNRPAIDAYLAQVEATR